MFNKTGKQLRIIGKEVISIFKTLKDDIRLEIKISKELRAYRKGLYEMAEALKEDPNAQAREDSQN